MKKEFTKPYQVWQRGEGNQFTFDEFDTLEEAIQAQKYGDWYLTKFVNLTIIDHH